jgi:hypothetical protein
LGFFGSKGIILSLVKSPNHWHKLKWSRLKICKNGPKPICGVVLFFFSFSLLPFDPKDHG